MRNTTLNSKNAMNSILTFFHIYFVRTKNTDFQKELQSLDKILFHLQTLKICN